MDARGGHAVVMGASMAGMLAARVLTEHFDRVTVLERDRLPDDPTPRRGVPQGCQPHVILSRCAEIVEELFPGYLAELIGAGAHRWDDGDLSRFDVSFSGHLMARTGRIPEADSLIQHYAARPLIEYLVRQRLCALREVRILDGHCVDTLISSGPRVTGVKVHRLDGSTVALDADLVVDATGRGSRAPVFLDDLGYSRPQVDELTVRVAYASMTVRMPVDALRQNIIVRLFVPGRPRGFVMSRCERDIWIVGAPTIGAVCPPTTPAELLDFGEAIAPEYALAAARAAEPLAGVSVHQYPSNRWRRYDKMRTFPAGFLVVGDAFCSFNPVYGQGMTIAAIEALILRDTLRHGRSDVARRFYRAAAKPVRLAWQTAVGSDLALPEVPGRPSMSMRVTNAYIERVLRAAEADPVVSQDFLRVIGMVAPPASLLRPSFILRVARGNRARRNAADEPQVTGAVS